MVFLALLCCFFFGFLWLWKGVEPVKVLQYLQKKHVAIGGTYITHRIDEIFAYLPVHEWLIFMVIVGKYTSQMNPIGYTWLYASWW